MIGAAPRRDGVGLLRIIEYPHPTLRHPSKPLKRVDAELVAIIREMFALMYASRGIGLAANQVDLPYRLFIVNLTGDPEQAGSGAGVHQPGDQRPQRLRGGRGRLPEPAGLVRPGEAAREGDAQRLHAAGRGGHGRAERHVCPRGAARGRPPGRRAVHRQARSDGSCWRPRKPLEEFELQFAHQRQRGEIPDDAAIAARLAELEKLRC